MPGGNKVRILAQVDDKASGPLDRLRDKFDLLGKSAAGKGLAMGAGIAAFGAVTNAAGEAADAVLDFAQDSREAWRTEQASIAGLDAALRANVESWDGNTEAIERTLNARMRLGFSDDEQRESLSRIVGATKDVTKALEVQSVAMDLARFKGISLAEASEALIKVEAGSYRILKSLGIELGENATQTEALAAVQRVATGQADAYAKTNSGKLLSSQIELGDAQEKLGKQLDDVLLPLQIKLTKAVADGVPVVLKAAGAIDKGLGGAFDALVDHLTENIGALEEFLGLVDDVLGRSNQGGDAVADLGQGLEYLTRTLLHGGDASAAMKDMIEEQTQAQKGAAQAARDAAAAQDDARESNAIAQKTTLDYKAAVDKAAESNRTFATNVKQAWRDSVVATKKGKLDLVAELNKPIDTIESLTHMLDEGIKNWKPPKIEAKQLSELLNSDQVKDALAGKFGPANKLIAEELTKNSYDRLRVIEGNAKAAADTYGNAYVQAIRRWRADVRDAIGYITGPGSGPDGAPRPPSSAPRTGSGVPAPIPRAHGGPVMPGRTYLVGEDGPELLVPRGAADIIPNGGATAVGGSVTLNMNVTLSGATSPGAARQFADEVGPTLARWMQQNGLLPRTASALRG